MKTTFFILLSALFINSSPFTASTESQDFQGKAYYFSQSKMELGNWGARMSEAQKKQMKSRLKNRLEKTFVLSFTKEASFFKEEEKDKLQEINWTMGAESKLIGQYMCFKATASIPTDELSWYDFSWGKLNESTEEKAVEYTQVEAWYTLQIPLRHGPAEYWGLPGLILEVSAGNTTMLCSQIVLNPKDGVDIRIPEKGKEVTKNEYQETVVGKMLEMRNNRGRRSN